MAQQLISKCTVPESSESFTPHFPKLTFPEITRLFQHHLGISRPKHAINFSVPQRLALEPHTSYQPWPWNLGYRLPKSMTMSKLCYIDACILYRYRYTDIHYMYVKSCACICVMYVFLCLSECPYVSYNVCRYDILYFYTERERERQRERQREREWESNVYKVNPGSITPGPFTWRYNFNSKLSLFDLGCLPQLMK